MAAPTMSSKTYVIMAYRQSLMSQKQIVGERWFGIKVGKHRLCTSSQHSHKLGIGRADPFTRYERGHAGTDFGLTNL